MHRLAVHLSIIAVALTFGLTTFAQEGMQPMTPAPSTPPAPPAPAPVPAPSTGEMKQEGEKGMHGDRHRDKAERKAQKERRKAERKAAKEKRKAEKKARKSKDRGDDKQGDQDKTDRKD
jgi:hypothetical protein